MDSVSRNLSLNAKGDDVRLLQNSLSKIGYLIDPEEQTEKIFAKTTEEAVRKFQSENGLQINGIVDDVTADKITKIIAAEADDGTKEYDTKTEGAGNELQERHDSKPTGLLNRQSVPEVTPAMMPDGGNEPPKAPPQVSSYTVSLPFIVKGKVVDAKSHPFVNGLIRAFDRDLRSENVVGSDTTDLEGRYAIRFSMNGSSDRPATEKSKIDLRIAAYDTYNKEIASSPVFFNAGNEETIDLVINPERYRGPSEYERLVAELNPLLEGSSLSLAQLTEDEEHQDITFLSGKTGQSAEHIAFLGLAHRLKQETQLEPEIFYGLFRNGLPTQLNILLRKGPDIFRIALEAALKENIIPFRFGVLLDEILVRLTELYVKKSVEPIGPEDPEKPQLERTSLAHLLNTVIQDRTKQELFVSAYIKHKGPISDFWKVLKSKPEFSQLVEDLEFTFQLATLTQNHVPLVQELQKMRRAGQITSISDLVRFDQRDWKAIISRPVPDSYSNPSSIIGFPADIPGKDDNEKAVNYSRIMARMIEDTCPTKFIARRLEEESEDYFDIHGKQDVITFLNANPRFDLRYGRLESYLSENKDALNHISDVKRTKASIKTMQRLYKMAPHYDQMSVLMKGGLKSAHAIARMGQNSFAAKYGKALGGDAAANMIHNRALDVQAKAITLLAEHGIASYKVPMSVLIDKVQTEVKDIPEWSTLFGSIDLCRCEQCRSVSSPAAYLVDLLHFLKDRPSSRVESTNGNGIENESVKDVLFERRPDIGEIELSCENTNIPLPYIDLVNEIMENAIWPFAPFSPFIIEAELEADLNSQKLSEDLIKDFSPPLSTSASITVEGIEEHAEPSWTIDDSAFTYTIRKDKTDQQLHVISRSLQTKGSALERGANPQYINTFAYDEVLRKSVYPWVNLPFDLWGEEARTYLGHLNTSRYQIMETFLARNRKREEIINDLVITREYLGLSSAETDLITGAIKSQPGAATPGIWNLWGFEEETLSFRNSIPDPSDSTRRIVTGNWLDVISQGVDVFLQQSGLEYIELLDLLDTVFINRFGTIQISSNDPKEPETCEIAKLQLSGFDSDDTAQRIMRFVRLWRKLRPRWSMRDLDRVIDALGISHPDDDLDDILDDAFVSQISHIERLRAKFNLPVINLLAFWKPIDSTTFYVDHSAPGQPRIPSLYADLFRNKTTSETLYPGFPENPKYLDGKDPTDPTKPLETLSGHATAISNALKITASEFQLLLGSSKVIPRKSPGGQEPVDILNIENLSLLYRHSVLAKSLKISILDYISFLDVIFNETTGTNGQQPFTSTTETLLFVENVETVKASPLNIRELEYVLRPVRMLSTSSSISSAVTPTEENIATVLYEIRNGMRQIIADNTINEELSRNGNYRVPLESLPPDFPFPSELASIIRYDTTSKELVASRYLFGGDRDLLKAAAPENLMYQAALVDLFNIQDDLTATVPLDILTGQKLALLNWNNVLIGNVLATLNGSLKYHVSLQASSDLVDKLEKLNDNGIYRVPLESLPPDFPFPSELASIIRYDTTSKELVASRYLFGGDRDLLKAAAPENLMYQAALVDLFNIQDELQGKISYNQVEHELEFTGIMTIKRRRKLKEASSSDLEYQNAIDALFEFPRNFVTRYMRRFSVPRFYTPLDGLPAGLQFPTSLKNKIYFDATEKLLHFLGVMTEVERDHLLELSVDPSDPNHDKYQTAVGILFNKADNDPIEDDLDTFLTELDANSMFDTPTSSGQRFTLLLEKLLPYLQRSLGEDLVSQKIAENLNLEHRVAKELLTLYVDSKRSHSKDPMDTRKNKSITDFVPTPPHFSAKTFLESNPNVELTRDKFPDQFNTFILLHKIATIITRFQVTNKQLFWIFEYGPNVGWLNLNTLPIIISDDPTVPDDPDVSFDQWLRLLELFKLRDRLSLGELILDEIFNIARSEGGTSPPDPEELVNQIRERLSENNRWNPTDLDLVVSEVFAAKNMPEKFQDERVMTRIWDCFLLINGLKMSAKLCRDLSKPDVTQDVSRSVRQSIRARYDVIGAAENTEGNEQWFSVAKPLRDGLREKQRTALVDYLVTHMVIPYAILESPHPILEKDVSSRAVKELKQKLNATGIVEPKPPLVVNNSFDRDTHDAVVKFQEDNGIEPADGVVGPETWSKLDKVRRAMRDRNDLYSHFVIDVEMNPCMVTSRIKQAVSSIQLFVQRSLMNLEESVEAGVEVDEGWRHWTWMKNYRVWEANRKVFLYPENWIEPELRDDKSPFFKELESKLLQDELTDQVAEDALLGYLAKLDEVARLQIVTMYHQVEQGSDYDTDILHVIGRTLTTPHVYYYRQYVKPGQWTTWEKVDLDIEGDHLLLIVWNRRLYLFWPIFELKDDPNSNNSIYKLFSGKIAWSERRQNNWLVKRESSFKEEILWPKTDSQGQPVPPPMPLVTLRSEIDANNNLLIIICGPSFNLNYPVNDVVPREALVFNGCNSDPVSIHYINHPERTINNTGHIYNFFYELGRELPYLFLPTPSNELPGLVVLDLTPGDFYLLPPHDIPDNITAAWVSKLYRHSFFYMDNTRTFFVSPELPERPERNWWKPGEVNPASVLRIQKNYYNELKAFQTNPASPTMVSNKESEILETSFEITPNNSVETATDLPSEVNMTSAKTQTKTTDIKNTSLRSAGLFSQNPNTDTPRAMSADRSTGETTKILSESIRSIMESNENPASLTDGQILAFMGFEQNEIQYRFHTFYHPYTCVFTRELNRSGVDGLLQRNMQIAPQTLPPPLKPLNFRTEYSPHDSTNPIPIVKPPYPEEDINFEYTEAYAVYNWELFFHIPLLIAERLSKNQQFEEAQKWFHRIFDPTDASTLESPQRYWRTKPFTTTEDYQKQRIQILLKLLAIGSDQDRRAKLTPDELLTLEAFENSVEDWRDNPFQPHLVARTRSTSYQKNVVMKYIDNLIAWGDQLFRRETIESINEATQLYIMASEILGRRPEDIPARVTHFVQTYNSLEPLLDDFFSNALIQIEELISPSPESHRSFNPGLLQVTDVTLPTILYFCVPKNEKLLGYWDTVADRLFKIRHCMNIQGTVRQLPLFEPPIDPALLVKAAAAGIDISSVLNDINPTLPLYRFNILTQKATELCSELKSLGAALLATLEKKDTEKLALIRAEHETSLLKLIELIKEEQYNQEVQNQVALRKSRDISLTKYLYYQKLLGVEQPKYPAEGEEIPDHASSSRAETEGQASVKMIPAERKELSHLKESESLRKEASEREFWANIYHLYPTVSTSSGLISQSFGGSNLGSAIQALANMAKDESAAETFKAAMVSRIGQYTMRAHEWSLQSNLAAKEIMQIDKQISAAEIRKEITKQELSNHVKQIQNARQVEDFMRSKYTNQELYSWMIGQVSAIYFQSYQLAYDVAKRAEAAYRFELGLEESNFIQFGYWDSLKRGLLVGERLYHDIKRLEVAYLEQNQREYEITKHVSLLRLDPVALAQLKQTGECFVSVPEALFDLDYPGHYFRRIKNASLTMPCVTGPYAGVNCTLTLLKSSIRHSNKLLGNNDKKYSRIKVGDDPRFRDNNGAIQSIVTSSGQNDSGLFETNLKDERYLPFEGSGAISEWHIQLPRDFRQFDYDTISDIVLHLRYTAREGGEPLRNQAITELQDALNEFLRTEGQNGLALPVSLRHEFPSEWHNFLNPQKDSHGHPTLTMNLGPERFPFLFQGRPILINKIEMFVKVRPIFAYSHNKDTLNMSLEPPLEPGTDPTENYLNLNPWNGLLRATKSKEGGLAGKLGNWTMTGWNEHEDTPDGRIDPNAIEDILVVCHYFLS